MKREAAAALIDRYLRGEATEREEALVQYWFAKESGKAAADDAYRAHTEMWAVISQSIEVNKVALRPNRSRVYKTAMAIAAAVAVITLGTWLYTTRHPDSGQEPASAQYANDIAPGKQGATLTLANGKQIRLSDATNGELAKEAGVTITKSEDGQLIYEIGSSSASPHTYNTLTTAKGETYQVKLPDGTAVWLNAASSLTYHAALTNAGKRRVTLEGEAYFQVAKDKNHPFVVSTGGQEVEVLGTQFNVNAYADEKAIATTLVEGSVKVSVDANSKVIAPGEQAVNNGVIFSVKKVAIDHVVDWKSGDFNLEGLDFSAAMRKIARWYDLEVVYEKDAALNFRTVGWISRDKKLSVILNSIESLGYVRFKVEGRKIYVTK